MSQKSVVWDAVMFNLHVKSCGIPLVRRPSDAREYLPSAHEIDAVQALVIAGRLAVPDAGRLRCLAPVAWRCQTPVVSHCLTPIT